MDLGHPAAVNYDQERWCTELVSGAKQGLTTENAKYGCEFQLDRKFWPSISHVPNESL